MKRRLTVTTIALLTGFFSINGVTTAQKSADVDANVLVSYGPTCGCGGNTSANYGSVTSVYSATSNRWFEARYNARLRTFFSRGRAYKSLWTRPNQEVISAKVGYTDINNPDATSSEPWSGRIDLPLLRRKITGTKGTGFKVRLERLSYVLVRLRDANRGNPTLARRQ